MNSRIPAIARKETLHILRDWRTLAMAFALPVILILLFGYAITFDIREIKLAVADMDQTSLSRDLVRRFTSSGYFKLVATPPHPDRLADLLDRNIAQIGLVIPEDYAVNVERLEGDTVQVIIDGSESNTATIAEGYVNSIFASLNIELVQGVLSRYGLPSQGIPPIDGQVRVWFNQQLESTNTIVPGLIAVIMMIIAAMLTSLTVVRERELGSLEGLIVTPVRKHEIIAGKMLPYLAISLIDCALIAVIGMAVFGVPFAGSVSLFLVTSLIFAISGLSIGLLASVVAGNQFLANQIVILSTLLPSIMLSGFMFPIKAMPEWVQALSYAVPARYFIKITRGIMLKDQAPIDMLRPTLFLVAFSVILLALAVRRFHKKL